MLDREELYSTFDHLMEQRDDAQFTISQIDKNRSATGDLQHERYNVMYSKVKTHLVLLNKFLAIVAGELERLNSQ